MPNQGENKEQAKQHKLSKKYTQKPQILHNFSAVFVGIFLKIAHHPIFHGHYAISKVAKQTIELAENLPIRHKNRVFGLLATHFHHTANPPRESSFFYGLLASFCSLLKKS